LCFALFQIFFVYLPNKTVDMTQRPLKIVYLTPALYLAGGVERVLTLKANYFAEHFGYDITIILTEGSDKPLFYKLSDKIKVVNLSIGFEELWTCSFAKKIFVYLKKQRLFKKALTKELMSIRPDITISLLRREINFINNIPDGSCKIGELHINRANYRNFSTQNVGIVKRLFAKFWSHNLVAHLRRLDKLVVLTEKDREAWVELDNVVAIPDPLSLYPKKVSPLTEKRVVAVARYSHEKGIDLLLQAWAIAEKHALGWRLDVYGDGDRTSYNQLMENLHIDRSRCELHGRTDNVETAYVNSSIFVLSSRFEGFGMVLTEAMACGLPVVSFDCPWGPRSIINDSADGLLVENGNVEALADGLIRLIGDDDLRRRMAANGIKNVQRFSIDYIAERWKKLFESTVR
jgi:glycosyltransferase involved in cell wall biosynthesis